MQVSNTQRDGRGVSELNMDEGPSLLQGKEGAKKHGTRTES